MSNEIPTSDLLSGPRWVDTPIDRFRRQVTVGVLIAAGLIFLVLVGGGMYVLVKADEKTLNAAQAILTTSIGVVAGVVGTIVGFFFQTREA